jgi:hypothetical protein
MASSFLAEKGDDWVALPLQTLIPNGIPLPSLDDRAVERHALKRSYEGPPHDMSWFDDRTLHYSLNRAQESDALAARAFPQLLPAVHSQLRVFSKIE